MASFDDSDDEMGDPPHVNLDSIGNDEEELPAEAPPDASMDEESDDEPDDALRIDEVVADEDADYSAIYKESNLNALVESLKEFVENATAHVVLACKGKLVEIDIKNDVYGWTKHIKYPTEQFKTFVASIPIDFVNPMPTNVEQRVKDPESIFKELKMAASPYDAVGVFERNMQNHVIEGLPEGHSVKLMQFNAFIPMLDLALQNPGYIALLNGSTLAKSFNFLNSSVIKTSDKQKMIDGNKEPVKTLNLRDVVYMLSSAGATKIVFYNATNGFSTDDVVLENKLNEQNDFSEVDDFSLTTPSVDVGSPAIPAEVEPEEVLEEPLSNTPLQSDALETSPTPLEPSPKALEPSPNALETSPKALEPSLTPLKTSPTPIEPSLTPLKTSPTPLEPSPKPAIVSPSPFGSTEKPMPNPAADEAAQIGGLKKTKKVMSPALKTTRRVKPYPHTSSPHSNFS